MKWEEKWRKEKRNTCTPFRSSLLHSIFELFIHLVIFNNFFRRLFLLCYRFKMGISCCLVTLIEWKYIYINYIATKWTQNELNHITLNPVTERNETKWILFQAIYTFVSFYLFFYFQKTFIAWNLFQQKKKTVFKIHS